jgi:hypothetical protein
MAITEEFHVLKCCELLLVKANVVLSSPIVVTLIMEEMRSSETAILTTATWCNIPEDGMLPWLLLQEKYADLSAAVFGEVSAKFRS